MSNLEEVKGVRTAIAHERDQRHVYPNNWKLLFSEKVQMHSHVHPNAFE